MDHSNHDQQQKDFLSSLFGSDSSFDQAQRGGSDNLQQNMFNQGQQPLIIPSFASSNDMFNSDVGNMMLMQGIESPSSHMMLEQQLRLAKLQQLQQLQNQIFQQQLELIHGQGGANSAGGAIEPPREPPLYHGLPTPVSSTELRAQPTADFVSPMILHYQQQQDFSRDQIHASTSHPSPDYTPHFGSNSAHSAPANLVFNTSPPVPLSSPADLEFDISPLTSPWFGAAQQGPPSYSIPNKRSASSSGDETSGKPSRKRQSPTDLRPIVPVPSQKKAPRATKSANSTPLLRSTRSRGPAADVAGDTPSPVDLSMPPPAPPQNNAAASSSTCSSGLATSASSSLTPVTPASIMNLGKLGLNSGLAPPPGGARQRAQTKSKSAPKAASKQAKSDASMPLVSPSLKPILPAGGPSSLNSANSSSSLAQPVLQVRKTSHKAAEQKRRDSLKTTFDDLRMLLPPIPVPSGETFNEEPVLPGSMPPRGPPKGEGPNRGVSKLQLLRCGNDFIRKLKGRIERRDDEIGKLRQEVMRLRGLVGDDGTNDPSEVDDLDLERDLDAAEPSEIGLRMGSVGDGDDADEEDD